MVILSTWSRIGERTSASFTRAPSWGANEAAIPLGEQAVIGEQAVFARERVALGGCDARAQLAARVATLEEPVAVYRRGGVEVVAQGCVERGVARLAIHGPIDARVGLVM